MDMGIDIDIDIDMDMDIDNYLHFYALLLDRIRSISYTTKLS